MRILVIGSGPLQVGQAGEFDYSGSQAIKALKEEGHHVVVINPNVASVQTKDGFADAVYLLPLQIESLLSVCEKESIEALLPHFGGQVALNLCVEFSKTELGQSGNIKILGTSIENIIDSENRQIFSNKIEELGLHTPKSWIINKDDYQGNINFPLFIKSSYSLGGEGSGLIETEEELQNLLAENDSLLVEESIYGWKEIEYEILRDWGGNCICICNMENLDPVGVHTGESIVVAPSQTLPNDQYQLLRTYAFSIANHFDVVGGCNVQFAISSTGEIRVIEINTRMSRSSALASKATGYPIAYIAAKLALGKLLFEIENPMTGQSAFFEPALDYIVTKIPFWDLERFGMNNGIGSSMKSVGEVMAIGKTFPESLQKAIRMLEKDYVGFQPLDKTIPCNELTQELRHPNTERLFHIASALSYGMSCQEVSQHTGYPLFFVKQMSEIEEMRLQLQQIHQLDKEIVLRAKKLGFSDKQIAMELQIDSQEVSAFRKRENIHPVIQQIDCTAGISTAKYDYLYLTYHGTAHDVLPLESAAIVLGGGPYRIGSSIEFDRCCVEASESIIDHNLQSIIVNCNPETVSTDYDVSSRLYFEELTEETITEIACFETNAPIIYSFGGQTPNNLSSIVQADYLGTSPLMIQQIENRESFSALLNRISIPQPGKLEVGALSFPCVARPSHVLSGANMFVIHTEVEWLRLSQSENFEEVQFTEFIEDAIEIEIDGIANNGKLMAYAITDQLEKSGTHSGDSRMVFPSVQSMERKERMVAIVEQILNASGYHGIFNIQLISKDDKIYVIEMNARASRNIPFLTKITGYNFIAETIKLYLNNSVKCIGELHSEKVIVKLPHFSPQLVDSQHHSIQMKSTGEQAFIVKHIGEIDRWDF